MNVILPQSKPARGKKHPVLWLLHGMSDDHSAWSRLTSIERYAAERKLAVIMPDANLSWYQDMASGPKYATFFRDELPGLAQGFFPVSPRRQDNFIAGLSMGGYGALYFALTQPERFSAAASLSGALDVAALAARPDEHRQTVLRSAYGNLKKIAGGRSDLLALARKAVRAGVRLPALYACCGTGDFLLDDNRRFVAQARKIGLPLLYEEHEGPRHEWGYWDAQIRRVIGWLPLGK